MKETDILKKAYEDVVWMAIRYANGRATDTPSMVRNSIKEFQKVFPDWKPRSDPFLNIYKKWNCNRFKKSDWLDDLVE